MKFNNMAALRDTLEQTDTQQLDDMLLKELRKESPNGELIHLISSILKERDRDRLPEIDENIQRAWERYQRKSQPVHKERNSLNSMLVKVASLMLVLFVLLDFIPQEAEAMNFFERFIAWTEDVFSLINPSETKENKEEYVFRTDNPGLQEVYDKVVELGVTDPVVPSWIPEGYELVECVSTDTPTKTYLTATFSNGQTKAVYQLDIYSENVTYEFYKGGTEIRVEEKNGIKHAILQNNDILLAVWTVDNMQFSISIDCPEDTLIRILGSIYTMEDI